MTAVSPQETRSQPVEEAGTASTFNLYPLLGILLLLVAAAMLYGGAVLFLLDE